MPLRTKRIYDDPEPEDGFRLLVMRRWPRGISKDKVDEWDKELGTPDDLIDDWKNDRVSWEEFRSRYREAMQSQTERIRELARKAADETITLLCGCKDADSCHRSILKEMIEERMD